MPFGHKPQLDDCGRGERIVLPAEFDQETKVVILTPNIVGVRMMRLGLTALIHNSRELR